PVRTLAVPARLIEPLLAVTLKIPLTARLVLAAWLMLPVLATTVRLPLLMATLPRLRAWLLVKAASAAEPLMSETAPLKALFLVRLMTPLAALKAAAPPTLASVPLAWVMLPALVAM